ncbi:MAG TPA: CoA-binding protein [Vicinamibacterales bacterium]|nr:CoA-binding protein [Vicinamibacterales bacterium]
MGPVPGTIAVIGASADRAKYGNKAVRAFRHQGWRVVPVNPAAEAVEGERAYASVLDYDGVIDEATLYVPPAVGLGVLDQLAQKGIRRVWLNPGADAPAVVARARALGLEAIVACSILSVGEQPAAY